MLGMSDCIHITAEISPNSQILATIRHCTFYIVHFTLYIQYATQCKLS